MVNDKRNAVMTAFGRTSRAGMVVSTLMAAAASAAPVKGVEAAGDGLSVRLGKATLRLQVWIDRVIRVRYAASGNRTGPDRVVLERNAMTFEAVVVALLPHSLTIVTVNCARRPADDKGR